MNAKAVGPPQDPLPTMPTFQDIQTMVTYGGEFNDIHGSGNRWTNASVTTVNGATVSTPVNSTTHRKLLQLYHRLCVNHPIL